MMQYLKLILSGKSKEDPTALKEVQQQLAIALCRITMLEERLESVTESIVELSNCVKEVAVATEALTQDVICVSEVIKQAATSAQKSEYDFFRWSLDDDDDGGYLN